MELVRGDRQVVDSQRLDRDRDLAHRLHRVAQHRHAALAQGRRQPRRTGWRVPSSLLASMRAASRVPGPAAATIRLRGHHPVAPRRHLLDHDSGAGGAGSRGAGIEGCSSAETTKRSPGAHSPRRLADHGVVGFGPRGNEDDLLRRPAADQPRHLLARGLDRLARRLSEAVDGGGIAPRLPPPRRARAASPPGPPGRAGSSRCGRSTSRASARILSLRRRGTGSATIDRDADPTSADRPDPRRLPVGLLPAPRPARPAGPQPVLPAVEPAALPRRSTASGSRRSTRSSPRRSAPPSSRSTRTTSATPSSSASGRCAIPIPDTVRNEMRETWSGACEQARLRRSAASTRSAPASSCSTAAPAARLDGQCAGTLWPIEIWVYPRDRAGPRSTWSCSSSTAASTQGTVPALVPGRRDSRALMQFAPIRARANDAPRESRAAPASATTRSPRPRQHAAPRARSTSSAIMATRAETPIAPVLARVGVDLQLLLHRPARGRREPAGRARHRLPRAPSEPDGRAGNPGGLDRRVASPAATPAPAPTTSSSTARSCSARSSSTASATSSISRSLPPTPRLPLRAARARRPPPGRSAPDDSGHDAARLRALPAPGHLHPDPQARGPQRSAASSAARSSSRCRRSRGRCRRSPTTCPPPSSPRPTRRFRRSTTPSRIVPPRGELQAGPGALRHPHHRNRDPEVRLRARRQAGPAQEQAALLGRARPRRGAAHPQAARQAFDDEGDRARLRRGADQRQRAPLLGAAGRAAPRQRSTRRACAPKREVELPEGGELERVEFCLNETLVATLYQEPFTQPIAAAAADGRSPTCAPSPTRSTATRPRTWSSSTRRRTSRSSTSSSSSSTPRCSTARTGRSGTCRAGRLLACLEDGVPQQLARFEQVENLPVHVAVLLDISASMEPNLAEAKAAALKFFESAITPKDRAALIAFNDRPNSGRSSSPTELAGPRRRPRRTQGRARHLALRLGRLLALLLQRRQGPARDPVCSPTARTRAAGSTSRRRSTSRAGPGWRSTPSVSTFARTDSETRKVLKKLADETGGRNFFIKEATELAAIYEAIEKELRSRYLLAYQSTNSSREQRFRIVEVKSAAPDSTPRRFAGTTPESPGEPPSG